MHHESERLRNLVTVGLKRIGSEGERAFDRATGQGFVAACDGQYADALSKGVGVHLLHAETTGALGAVFHGRAPRLGTPVAPPRRH